MKIFSKIIFTISILFFIAAGLFFVKSYVEMNRIPEPVPEPVESFASGVVLAPTAGLNLYGRDEKMHKISSLQKGEILQLLQIDGELQEKVFSETDAAEEKYFHAVHDNLDYWVFEDYVALDCVPALIIEKSKVYMEENAESQVAATLSFATIVAVKESNEEKPFALVRWFDKSQQKILEGFIPSEKVSTYMDDVQVAAIVEKLRNTWRAVARNDLFKKAFSLKPSPKMLKVLQGEQVEVVTNSYKEAVRALPGSRYQVNMGELNTVDQSRDPFAR
ncbi:MAG: hypothetical protein KBT11_01570 [Treponema sp.]|nr:hypothetical protein [Candidatus Treponema equifaecale]